MDIHPSLWTQLLQKILGTDLVLFDHVIAAFISFLVIVLLGLILRAGLKKGSETPGHFQQLLELVTQGLLGMIDENIGKEGRKYMPLIGGLAFFIFISNFLGMVPSFSSSTGNLNTTIACAVIVFIYYNWEGLRENGIGYIKHFMGPVPAMAPLIFPIEVISHLARPFSLGIRLFGNITGEHIVAGVFYSMLPWLLPVPLMTIGLFAAFLQTFIFLMLTMVYIAGAIAHEH